MGKPYAQGTFDPIQPLGNLRPLGWRAAAGGVLKDRPHIRGIPHMPGSRLLLELVDHVGRQAEGGSDHRLRLHPVAVVHFRAGVVGVVVLGQSLEFRRWPGESFGMFRHGHRAFLWKVLFSASVMARAVTMKASSPSAMATTNK